MIFALRRRATKIIPKDALLAASPNKCQLQANCCRSEWCSLSTRRKKERHAISIVATRKWPHRAADSS